MFNNKLSITNVGAAPGGDAFLLVTAEKAALIDSGFAFCAEKMISNVESVLGSRELDFVILTHTHYDHMSGSANCRLRWPNVRVFAGEYAEYVLSRPGAIATVRKMNDSAAALFGCEQYPDALDSLHIDTVVRDGDVIDLGGITLQTIEAPGHTRCSLAFYSPEARLLVACESFGTQAEGDLVVPCCLIGYSTAAASIRKAAEFEPEAILQPHFGLMTDSRCQTFFDSALRELEAAKNFIIDGHRAGKSRAELIQMLHSRYYVGPYTRCQPEDAFLLNAGYMVAAIIREFGKSSGAGQ